MSDKYYTPELEEFHVGFEYELLHMCVWNKNHIDTLESFLSIRKELNNEYIRVKYLDKQDIESLNWKDIGPKTGDYIFNDYRFKNYRLICIKVKKDNIITIKYLIQVSREKGKEVKTIYFGIIKNKSEFKRIIKQLNIR